jgi:hypothetical protein
MVSVNNQSLVTLSKKLWAYLPGSDNNGYSTPGPTLQFAFGIVDGATSFAQMAGADGYLDERRLIGGIHLISGDQSLSFNLPPGRYRLYEFTLVRAPDGVTLKFAKMGGWQFKALVNGIETAAIGDENAVPFEVFNDNRPISLVGINKTLSVLPEKYAAGKPKPGVLFFATSSSQGIFPDSQNWNGAAIVRMGVTDERGSVRLDGFTSGGNIFLLEVIPKADYAAGVRAIGMEVYRLDGSLWFNSDFPLALAVTQQQLDQLMRDPKLNAAARDLIGKHLHVGDYLCSGRDYLYERQGMLRVKVTNGGEAPPKVKLCKKLWAGLPGSDSKDYSAPNSTLQFAFGVVGIDTSFAQMAGADGYLDESRLIGGIHWVIGDQVTEFSLSPGKYRLYEFTLVRAEDGVSLKFAKMGGWQFKAEVNGVETNAIDDENAIPFEVRSDGATITLMGINKTLCALVEIRTSAGQAKPGTLVFGTSTTSGLFPDKLNWTAPAIVRVGVGNEKGDVRLDGFTSGGNIMLHQVIPKADYEAGVRATKMEVFGLNGALVLTCDLPMTYQLTQLQLDQLLREPKLSAAARELVRAHLHVGDYLSVGREYFNERQGMLRVRITNNR